MSDTDKAVVHFTMAGRGRTAQQVYNIVFVNTETLGHANIGVSLVYLMGAILCGTKFEPSELDVELLRILDKYSPRDHAVWHTIVIDPKTLTPKEET